MEDTLYYYKKSGYYYFVTDDDDTNTVYYSDSLDGYDHTFELIKGFEHNRRGLISFKTNFNTWADEIKGKRIDYKNESCHFTAVSKTYYKYCNYNMMRKNIKITPVTDYME